MLFFNYHHFYQSDEMIGFKFHQTGLTLNIDKNWIDS